MSYQSKIYVKTCSSLVMTESDRAELTSPHHALTILVNKKHSLCHILGIDTVFGISVGAQDQGCYMRLKLPSKVLRTETDYALTKWLSVRLTNLLKHI